MAKVALEGVTIVSRGFTLTARGEIPYITHPTGILLPVAVETEWHVTPGGKRTRSVKKSGDGFPFPAKHLGRLVYALPGGGRYIP